ncbi:hypothetical protein ACL02T_12655 [Pseudonocardia sp. RS010]|uniref:hypothetical protein n=1 Tax=Pseudonocardia sp. RS010 TaxID=3385979 RepID=UPI0039A00966
MTSNVDEQPPAVDVDELSADPEVAALEQRILDGDETITADQLADARVAAAGRSMFGRLRARLAERQARAAADQLAAEQAAAAEEHARAALAPYAPAELVGLYDRAVEALRAYSAAVEGYNATLHELVGLSAEQRHAGASRDRHGPWGDRVELDGRTFRREQHEHHLRRLLGAAGIGHDLRAVDRQRFALDDRDPDVIAEGRAQLAAKGNRKRGA